MTTLYLTEQYSLLKKDGDTLVVHIPANKEQGTDKRKVRVPMMKVDQVVVVGNCTVTTGNSRKQDFNSGRFRRYL